MGLVVAAGVMTMTMTVTVTQGGDVMFTLFDKSVFSCDIYNKTIDPEKKKTHHHNNSSHFPTPLLLHHHKNPNLHVLVGASPSSSPPHYLFDHHG